MKKLIVIAMSLAGLVLASTTAEAGRLDRRHRRQESRIAEGVKSGDLTRDEAKELRRQQRRIRRAQRRAHADGTITHRERARLELRQDAAHRNIYRERNDDEKR